MVDKFSDIISQSPSHIYLSALAFAPPQSLIFKHYRGVYPHTLIVRTPPNDTILPVITTAIAGNIVAAVIGNTWLKVFDLACDGKQMLSVPVKQLEIEVDEYKRLRETLSYSVAISPSKELVALGRDDCRIFNIDNFESPLRMENENDVQASITYLAFSQDSQQLAAVYGDGTVHEWNTNSGMMTPNLVWDPESYQQKGRAVHLMYSEDGLMIVSRHRDKIYLWGKNGEYLSSYSIPSLGHSGKRTSFLTIGSTEYVVVAESEGYYLYELLSGELRLETPNFNDDVYSSGLQESSFDYISPPRYLQPLWHRLTVSRDHRLAADRSMASIAIYDLEQDKLIARLVGHSWEVVSLSFIELEGHGEYCLFSASRDGTIRLWDLSTLLERESTYNLPIKESGYHRGGWIKNSKGESLFFLPRSCPFRHPLNSLVIGPCADLDLTHFVYGKEWTRCKDPIDPDEEGSGIRIEDLIIEGTR
jgi:WD40 repeat protein